MNGLQIVIAGCQEGCTVWGPFDTCTTAEHSNFRLYELRRLLCPELTFQEIRVGTTVLCGSCVCNQKMTERSERALQAV